MCVFNRINQALGIVEQRNYTSTVIDSIFDAATNGPSNARVGATAGLGAVSGFVAGVSPLRVLQGMPQRQRSPRSYWVTSAGP